MAYALPIAYALFLWWFATGLIFFLDQLPVRTFKWSMAGGTVPSLMLWRNLVAVAVEWRCVVLRRVWSFLRQVAAPGP